jgi:hypothetical protein
MRRLSAPLVALLAASAFPLRAQDLGSRIARLPAGEIRMTFAARPGVCGDGRTVVGDASAPGGMAVYWYGGEGWSDAGGGDFRRGCVPGAVRVRLLKASGAITDVRAYVGGEWRGPGEDLGTVSTAAAVTYLLGLARNAPQRASGTALLAATLADSVQLTGRLTVLARDRTLGAYVRERALRWLTDVAEREGAIEQADRAARDIVLDAGDITSVRDRAIRALSTGEATDSFLRDQFPRLGVASLQDRVVRRLGESPTAANVAWLRTKALDAGAPLSLRDRALRVLGEDLGERDLLQQIYPTLIPLELRERVIRLVGEEGDPASDRWLRSIVENPQERRDLRDRALRVLAESGSDAYLRETYPHLDDPTLKDRILRLVAENGDQDGLAWLQTIARDESQSVDLRDRALRSWAEAGAATADLVRLYDGIGTGGLRQRIIRLLAEKGDDAAVDKLIAVARSDPDESLRRFAMRRLAETGNPKARQFVEETVKR